MTVLFQLASWHWYYLILLYQMCHILSHPVPATILFRVQVTKILLCLKLRHRLHLPNIRTDNSKRPRQKWGCIAPGVTESGWGRHRGSPSDQEDKSCKAAAWSSGSWDGRRTAQRETVEKPPNAVRNHDSERGDLTERRRKGPRCLRAVNLNE